MQQVPIQAIPNQQFSIVLDNNSWNFVIKETNGVMSVSLALNGDQVLDNARAVGGSFIIPSKYEESGNFIFLTTNNQLPEYAQFNVNQSLVYVTAAELAVFRTKPTPPITAADFNPIAALPLRFSPQGYVLA